jgi:signal peptidase II
VAAADRHLSRRSRWRGVAPIPVALAVVAVDQLAKWLVVATLGPGQPTQRRELLGDALTIHYVENTGMAFGILRDQTALVSVLALAVVVLLIRAYRRAAQPSLLLAVACGLVCGGAAGNLIDRLRLGYVVDFIGVSIWPKFNVADVAITIGALMLVWWYWLGGNPAQQQPRSERRPEAGTPATLRPDVER